jgi:hypothetical protein
MYAVFAEGPTADAPLHYGLPQAEVLFRTFEGNKRGTLHVVIR